MKLPGIALAAAGLAVATTASLPAMADEPLIGRYRTNYGPLKLFADKDGVYIGIYSYKGLPAHLYLTANSEGFYDAFWIQGTSEVRCRTKKTGSPYWGRARIAFKGTRIISLWNYCNRKLVNDKRFRWTGDFTD